MRRSFLHANSPLIITHTHTQLQQDLVKKLLNRDDQSRLGNLKGGMQDITDHKWFMGYDWDLYMRQQVKAPMVPKIKGDLDTSHFDPLGVDDHTDDGGYVDRGDWDKDF